MNIHINNKEYVVTDNATIADAIAQVDGLPSSGIAIALNNDVVPASQWATKALNDGDRLTVIKAFYGG